MNESKFPVLMSRTRVFSKKASRADADNTTEKFKEILAKEHDLEAKCNDVSATQIIGTFHWYGIKVVPPPEHYERPLFDILKLRTLQVLEIRNYESGQDNRAIFVMGTKCEDLDAVSKSITDFYKQEGYEKCLDLSRVDVTSDAKF